MSGGEFNISVNATQFKRLKFLVNTLHPVLDENGNDEKTVGGIALEKKINEIFNEGLKKYYSEVVGHINQGNEHDGLPLIKEIYD